MMRFDLWIFPLWMMLLVSITFLLSPGPWRFSPVIFFCKFYSLQFTFKHIIYFDLIFYVRSETNWGSLSWLWMSKCSCTICWKAIFPPFHCFCTFIKKISWAYLYGSISEFSVFFHCVYLSAKTTQTPLWWLYSYIKPWNQVE